MADDVKIGSASIDVRADDSKLKSDFEKAKSSSKKAVDDMNNQLSKIKMSVDASVLKMKFSEAEKWRNDLQAKFEKQIKMNADVSTIQKTKAALDSVNSSLSGMKKAQDDVVNNASKWGMIATGIQSAVQAVQQFSQQMKQLIGQSVNAAAGLEVLRSNFRGSTEDLELFKRATAGTVSEANLIELSNQSSALGLSLQQQAIFFSLAEDAADKFGGGVKAGMEGVIRASEGSIRAISSLGIQKKVFEERVKELAKAEGELITNLDGETQKRIRLQAIIELSGITLSDVKNKTKDEKDLIESLGVSFDEAKIKLGNFILQGLTPLLKKFDESNSGLKNFITGIVSMGGIIIGAIPLIVQLYSAKKIFAGASLMSAAAVGTEATAIELNTVAKVANSKVMLGMLGTVGAIIGVVSAVIWLTAEINKNTDAIKKNREEANLNTGFGQDYATGKKSTVGVFNRQGNLPTTGFERDVVTGALLSNEVTTANKKMADSVFEVRNRIIELQKANDEANITWAQYYKNLAEISRLQDKLKPQINYGKPVGELAPTEYKPDFSVKGGFGKPTKKSGNFNPDLGLGTDAQIMEEWVRQSEVASAAMDGFINGALQGLGRLRIKVADDANFMAQAFVGFANAAIQALEQIIAKWAVLNILSMLAGGGGISLLSILGLKEGGTVFNGAKIPAFAGGVGSYMVPNGYPNDSYPVMVQSGEDLRVRTPQQRQMAEMDNGALLGELTRINKTLMAGMNQGVGGQPITVITQLDGKTIAESVTRQQNRWVRANKHLSDL